MDENRSNIPGKFGPDFHSKNPEMSTVHHQNLQESLEDLLRFEKLLLELSAAFVSLTAGEIDTEIKKWLNKLVDFLGIDSCSISEMMPDGSCYHITHFYNVPGFREPPIRSSSLVPWYTEKLLTGEILVLKRVPAHVPREQAKLWKDVKLHVSIPLKVGNSRLGAIGFSSSSKKDDWSNELLQRLRLIGEVFANALERKRVELEIQGHRDELAHVARVAMLDELAASLAHELNQPLTAILSNAQAAQRFMAQKNVNLEEVREALGDIIKDNWRASEVIKRLRELAKKSSYQKSEIHINDMIRDVLTLVRGEAGQKEVTIVLDLAENLHQITGDRIQLQQVLLNLFLNSFNAMNQTENGCRELKVSSFPDNDGFVTVAIKDVGIGIDPDKIKRVFDAFFTTRPDGMGMGLSICRTIIETHRGRIWGEQNPDKGMTFFFALPTGESVDS